MSGLDPDLSRVGSISALHRMHDNASSHAFQSRPMMGVERGRFDVTKGRTAPRANRSWCRSGGLGVRHVSELLGCRIVEEIVCLLLQFLHHGISCLSQQFPFINLEKIFRDLGFGRWFHE